MREGGVAEELAQDSLEAIRSRLADIDALGGLPYRRRAAVSLRYWTDDQIADALGCAPAGRAAGLTADLAAHEGVGCVGRYG